MLIARKCPKQNPCKKKVRRQVHWTRGPSNVSRRIRLTPRNRWNRSSRVLGAQPPAGRLILVRCPRTLPPEGRCPKTPFQHPVPGLASSNLRPKACCSSGGPVMVPRPERFRALIVQPQGPFHLSPRIRRYAITSFPARPIQTHPRFNPLAASTGLPT